MRQDYSVLSTKKCKTCNQTLKANLVNTKENATHCYKCYRKHIQNKPTYHVPREKRIKAGLPVHNYKMEN